jgi:tetratricopeptide (TPR) repeat protein
MRIEIVEKPLLSITNDDRFQQADFFPGNPRLASMRFSWSHALVIILMGLIVNSRAQAASAPNSWAWLMVQGKNRHDPACFLAAANIAEHYGPHDPRLHLALHNAALEYHHHAPHGDAKLAELLYKKDIACLEQLDKDFPDIVPDCWQLATLYTWQSRLPESEAVLLRALSIRNKWVDNESNDPYNADLYALLYINYTVEGKVTRAREARAQMLASLKRLNGKTSRAQCLSDLDDVFFNYARDHGQLQEARQFYQAAQEFSDEAIPNWGRINDSANQMRRSAQIAWCLHDPAKAVDLLRKSLTLYEGDFKSNHKSAYWSMRVLCEYLANQKRPGEFQQAQSRYLADTARAFGTDSPEYEEARLDCDAIMQEAKDPLIQTRQDKQSRLIQQRLHKYYD